MRSSTGARKLIVNYLIPAVLIGVWILFMFYRAFVIEKVFSIVTDSYSSGQLISTPDGKLLQGQKIVGEFTANYDHLGIIGFRFWNYNQINKDRVKFRIKEKNSSTWHYEYEYATDQFPANGYFTFGFPPIDESKGKTFTFEVQSIAGTPNDAIGVSEQKPFFIVKYQYPKKIILSSFKSFFGFAGLKLYNLIKNSEFTSFVYIYLLPAILYILYILGPGRKVSKSIGWQLRVIIPALRKFLYNNKIGISHIILASGIITDTFLVRNSDLTLTILIIMIIALWIIYKRNFDEIFVIALVSLTISNVAYYLNDFQVAERAASWVWIFLVIWMINRLCWIYTNRQDL